MSTREQGMLAEEAAAEHLRTLGYRVLDRNFRTRLGEIDIVAQDGETVVFVEVRSRADAAFGSPQETVGFVKRRRIIKAAAFYAQSRRLDCPMRFDVIAIVAGRLEHIPGAFSA